MVTNETLELKTVVKTLDNVQERLSSHLDLTHEVIAAFENTLNRHSSLATRPKRVA